MSMIKKRKRGILTAFVACCALQLQAATLQAATLQECEKVKARQLQAEQGGKAGGGKKGRSSGKGPSKRRQNIEKLDEWLWKNCGNFSYELRRLEQERM